MHHHIKNEMHDRNRFTSSYESPGEMSAPSGQPPPENQSQAKAASAAKKTFWDSLYHSSEHISVNGEIFHPMPFKTDVQPRRLQPPEGSDKAKVEKVASSSFSRAALKGASYGAVETSALFWTVTWVNRYTSNLPMIWNFKELYRGYPLQLVGMAGTFAVINCTNEVLKKKVSHESSTLTFIDKAKIAFFSGCFSAVSNSVDMLQVLRTVQQKENAAQNKPQQKITAWDLSKKAYSTAGVRAFTNGTVLGAIRNGGYAVGVNAVAPEVSKFIRGKMPEGVNPYVDFGIDMAVAGSIGAATAVATQPIHTVKTLMHMDLARQKYANPIDAAMKVYRGEVFPGKKGATAFFTHSTPRIVRVIGGFPIVYGMMKLDEATK